MQRVKIFAKIFTVILIIITGMLFFFQEQLIFRSTKLPKDHKYTFTSDFEELFLTAEDGAVLNGIHFKRSHPEGIILYCHGNAGGLDVWGFWAQELANRYNYDVLVWDYRGYGKSSGKRRQAKMMNDGLLFYKYCKQHYDESKIVVFGRSLGGFFATYLAMKEHPGQLILESTPTSILEMAQREYPLLPSKILLKFRFQNDRNIGYVKVPTYIIHGTDDGLVPYDHGKELFELSGAETKKLMAIEGGNHNDLGNYEDYFEILDQLLAKD